MRKVQRAAHRLLGLVRTRTAVFLILTILALLAFEEVADDVFQDVPAGDLEALDLDRSVAAWMRAARSPRLTQSMTDITALGSVSVLVAVFVGVVGILLLRRDGRSLLNFLVVGAGALFIPRVLKIVFDRPRPDFAERLVWVTDLSFPSGHAFGAAAIYAFLVIYAFTHLRGALERTFAAGFAMALIVLVGFSRIYLGAHHTTDVLGGLAAGLAWTFAVAFLFEWSAARRR